MIRAAHYSETENKLMGEFYRDASDGGLWNPVGRMAQDVTEFHGSALAALDAIAHPAEGDLAADAGPREILAHHRDRTPRHSFMGQANAGYPKMGGQVEARHLGAVAACVVNIIACFAALESTDLEDKS